MQVQTTWVKRKNLQVCLRTVTTCNTQLLIQSSFSLHAYSACCIFALICACLGWRSVCDCVYVVYCCEIQPLMSESSALLPCTNNDIMFSGVDTLALSIEMINELNSLTLTRYSVNKQYHFVFLSKQAGMVHICVCVFVKCNHTSCSHWFIFFFFNVSYCHFMFIMSQNLIWHYWFCHHVQNRAISSSGFRCIIWDHVELYIYVNISVSMLFASHQLSH